MKYFAVVGENEYELEFDDGQLFVNGEAVTVDFKRIGDPELYSMLLDGHSYELLVEADRYTYAVTVFGNQFEVQIEDERTRRMNAGRRQGALPDGEAPVRAPIPGLVVKVLVSEGESIEQDQPMLILEAMKMENEIRAPRACVVKKIDVQPGQRVEQNAALIIVE